MTVQDDGEMMALEEQRTLRSVAHNCTANIFDFLRDDSFQMQKQKYKISTGIPPKVLLVSNLDVFRAYKYGLSLL